MANDRREHVKQLLEAALECDPSDRQVFLNGAFALDPSIREEVESVIASHDEADSYLEKFPAKEIDEQSRDTASVTVQRRDETDSADKKQIGPYRILREIGRGGMGVVYEAEQEKPVRRKVALKLIKWGMDTKAVIARFESERQALALMNHPNIASVHDAGATEEGRPYFAMEYVHGIPITEYCDKHRLTIKERLELFIQVCEGVQHAHQKGIIHRDIKPSNVLVAIQDDKPVPTIIDFGVAKATSQRLTEHTVYTELGQLIGTPEYMSPEQAEMTNLDIDTRTDVYSLGVVLYELLVGAQLFDPKELRESGLAEIQRKLREDEPPRPSTRLRSLGESSSTSAANRRVDVKTLERQLRSDLDWITMKALEKDRTRRYASVPDLLADIRRHLRDEPILAGAPSTTYRLNKFLRRHRSGVVVAVAIGLSLFIGAAIAFVQANRARRAEEAATRRRQQADALISFMLGDLREQLTKIGRIDILDAAAEQSLEYFNTLVPEDVDSDSLRRYWEALRFIGSVRVNQGKPKEALVAFERAQSLAEELTDREPNAPESWHQRYDMASDLGEAYWELKQEEKTLQLISEAVEHLKRAIALDPANEEYLLDLAEGYNNLGAVNTRLRNLASARDWFDHAIETTEILLQRKPDFPDYLNQKVETASWLGELYMLLGDFPSAIQWNEEEIGLRSRLLRLTENPRHKARLADAYGYYAKTLSATGDYSGAVEKELEQTRLYADLRQHDPTNMMWRHSHEFGLALLAELEFDAGESTTAKRRIEGSRAATQALLESAPENIAWGEEQAYIDTILARFALDSDLSTALTHAQSALGRLGPLLEEETVRPTVMRTFVRGSILASECGLRLENTAAVEKLATKALGLLTEWGNSRESVFDTAYQALLLQQLGRFDEATQLVQRLSTVGFEEPLYQSLLKR